MKSRPTLGFFQAISLRRGMREVERGLREFHEPGTTIEIDTRKCRDTLEHLGDPKALRLEDETVYTELSALIDSWKPGLHSQAQGERDARQHRLDRLAGLVEPARRQLTDLIIDAERRIKGIHDVANFALDSLIDPDTPPTYPSADEWKPGTSASTRRERRANGDPSVIVGRSWGALSTWVAVLLAAGVDVATFYQVMQLVISAPGPVIVLAVIGFAGVGLSLAHTAGKQAHKALHPRNYTASGLLAWVFGGIWLSLGVLAFVVRYVISAGATGGSMGTSTSADGSTTAIVNGADLTSQHLYAAFFFVLYIATGAVAAHAGFTSPASAARRHRRAVAQRTRAVRRLAKTSKEFVRVDAASWSISEARKRTDEAWQTAVRQCDAELEGLKRMARLQLIWARPAALVPPASGLPADPPTPPEEETP